MSKILIVFLFFGVLLSGVSLFTIAQQPEASTPKKFPVENAWSWNDNIGWTCIGGTSSAACPTANTVASRWGGVVYNENDTIFEEYAWNDLVGYISFGKHRIPGDDKKGCELVEGTPTSKDLEKIPRIKFGADETTGEVQGYACILSLGEVISFSSNSTGHPPGSPEYFVKAEKKKCTESGKDFACITLSGCAWSDSFGWFSFGSGAVEGTDKCGASTVADAYVNLEEDIDIEINCTEATLDTRCGAEHPVVQVDLISVEPKVFRVNPGGSDEVAITLNYRVNRNNAHNKVHSCSVIANGSVESITETSHSFDAYNESRGNTLTHNTKTTTEYQIQCEVELCSLVADDITADPICEDPIKVNSNKKNARLVPYQIGN